MHIIHMLPSKGKTTLAPDVTFSVMHHVCFLTYRLLLPHGAPGNTKVWPRHCGGDHCHTLTLVQRLEGDEETFF